MSVEHQKLRFNLDKPLDREAWEIIQAVPSGKRSRFIMNAIIAHEQRQVEEEQQERLAERIADLVADRLSDCSIPITAAAQGDPSGPDADTLERSLAIADEFMAQWD